MGDIKAAVDMKPLKNVYDNTTTIFKTSRVPLLTYMD